METINSELSEDVKQLIDMMTITSAHATQALMIPKEIINVV